MHCAALGPGVDADGVIRIVSKLHVQGAIVHRGVQTNGHIAHGEHVHGPLDDLQVGLQGRIVQRRGHLADAAAHFLGNLTVYVCASNLITLGGGTLAGGAVEGEHLVRHQNRAVDRLASQRQVCRPGIAGGLGRVHSAKQVPEQHGVEIRRCDLRFADGQGQLQGIPCFRLVQQGLCRFQIEHIAGLLGGDLSGLPDPCRVLDLGIQLVIQRLQIEVLDLDDLIVPFKILGIGGGVGLGHCVIQPVRVQMHTLLAQLKDQQAVCLLRRLSLCGRRLRRLLLDGIGGLAGFRFHILRRLLDHLADGFFVQSGFQRRVRHRRGGIKNLLQQLIHLVQFPGAHAAEPQLPVRQGHHQCVIPGLKSFQNGVLRLLEGHPVHIHTQNGLAPQNLVGLNDRRTHGLPVFLCRGGRRLRRRLSIRCRLLDHNGIFRQGFPGVLLQILNNFNHQDTADRQKRHTNRQTGHDRYLPLAKPGVPSTFLHPM